MTSWQPNDLPFDQYKRYQDLAWLLGYWRSADEPLRLLEVGGYLRGGNQEDLLPLSLFVNTDNYTVIDTKVATFPRYIQASGTALPFIDQSFDVVAAMDTLEHVPPENRQLFTAECARVASRSVIVMGPFQSQSNDVAERYLLDYLLDLFPEHHETLSEHLSLGLPEAAATIAQLQSSGFRCLTLPSGNIHTWLSMMVLRHFLMQYPESEALTRFADRYYNVFHAHNDHREPTYRTIVIAVKERDGKLLDRIATDFKLSLAAGANDDWRDSFIRLLELIGTHHFGFVKSRRPAALQDIINQQDIILNDRQRLLSEQRKSIEELRAEQHRLIVQIKNSQTEIAELNAHNQTIEGNLSQAHHSLEELTEKLSDLSASHQELMAFRDKTVSNPAYKLLSWVKNTKNRGVTR